MNQVILDQVLKEQVDNHACAGQPFVEFFEGIKECPLFEQMVRASMTSLNEFPLSPYTVIKVYLGYALYSGAAYAKAEREVQQLEELT